MNAEETVRKLLPIFLEGDPEKFQQNIVATEAAIRDNHKEIIEFLKHNTNVDVKTLNILKAKLDLEG